MSRITLAHVTVVDAVVRIYGHEVGSIVHGAPDRDACGALARYARETGRPIEAVMRTVCALVAKG